MQWILGCNPNPTPFRPSHRTLLRSPWIDMGGVLKIGAGGPFGNANLGVCKDCHEKILGNPPTACCRDYLLCVPPTRINRCPSQFCDHRITLSSQTPVNPTSPFNKCPQHTACVFPVEKLQVLLAGRTPRARFEGLRFRNRPNPPRVAS